MIFNVNMASSGSNIRMQTKTVDSSFSNVVVTPDVGYDALARVDVNAMSMTTTENASGGLTVVIGNSSL